MSIFQSTKVFDGFSTVFRQWRAEHTHCKYLHGYAVSFKLWFEGELDERNWVWDFGGFSRSQGQIEGMAPKQWMSYMFDHTLIVAEDDPALAHFIEMDKQGLVQVRVVATTGAESFARLIYEKINPFILSETQGRVKLIKVEFRENHKNSAIYKP
jgi:6-pyruvoyltetrahydropterin/6-carboxytetrahydropterin synthase